MKLDRFRLEEAVVSRLGPFLGNSMARAALVGHCRKLGFEEEAFKVEEVEQVLKRLRQGMTLFVGTEKAQALADLLRQDLKVGTPT